MKIAGAAGALAVSLVLAACGSASKAQPGTTSSSNPKQAVQAAVSNLLAQPDVEMVLSLPVSADQARQLSAEGGGNAGGKAGGKPMSQAEADALSSGSIFVNMAKGSLDAGLTIHDNVPLEVVYAGGALYAHAHLQQLLTDVGQDPAKATQFSKQLGTLEPYVPGISYLAQGQWVEIDHAGLQSLAPLLQQIPGSAHAGSLKADLMSLPGQVMAALEADSTFRSTGSGRYAVTVRVPQFLATLQPAIDKALSDFPVVGSQLDADLAKLPGKVPAGQTAVITLTTAGGRLSQAQVDLSQFAGKGRVGFPVPLRVAFSSPGAPKAPAGAHILDVSKLPGLLGALLGTKGAGSAA